MWQVNAINGSQMVEKSGGLLPSGEGEGGEINWKLSPNVPGIRQRNLHAQFLICFYTHKSRTHLSGTERMGLLQNHVQSILLLSEKQVENRSGNRNY